VNVSSRTGLPGLSWIKAVKRSLLLCGCLITCDIITMQNVRLVLVGLTHEMSYTADSNSNRYSRFECKRPICRSLISAGCLYNLNDKIQLHKCISHDKLWVTMIDIAFGLGNIRVKHRPLRYAHVDFSGV